MEKYNKLFGNITQLIEKGLLTLFAVFQLFFFVPQILPLKQNSIYLQ